MALKRIFDLKGGSLNKILITNVTETIYIKTKEGTGEVTDTVNAGEQWTSRAQTSIGVFIGTTLIGGGASSVLAGGNGCWFRTDETDNFSVFNKYVPATSDLIHCYADIPEGLEQLTIEGDYDSVIYGTSSYPKPASITLNSATSKLKVVNPVKEITVKYTDTNEPTVTVTTTM